MYKLSYLSFVVIFLLAFFLPNTVEAQADSQVSGGSFYSGIGFGAPVDQFSPYSMGMGLTGVSNYTGFSPSISNPSHWGLIRFSQGNLAASVNQFEARDQSDIAQNASFAIESFQLAFPIFRDRLGMSVSFTPTVRNEFRQVSFGEFNPLPGFSDNIEYEVSTIGSGGINRFEAGFGFRVTDFLSVGYAISSNQLTINHEMFPAFSNIEFRSNQFNRKLDGNAFGHRFGVYAFRSGLLRSEDQLAFGATLSLPLSISAEESITSFRQINNQRVRIELNENSPQRFGSVKLPLEINTGLTYNLNRFTNVVAELLIQRWDEAEYSFNQNQEQYFKDRVRAGLGFQYHPYRSDQPGGFLSNIKYSIGTTYDSGHLSIHGQDIETIFLNAGIGLMSQRTPSSIDLSFHYGFRGTDSSNLVKENIWGFKLSLNMAELMFLRQRFQ